MISPARRTSARRFFTRSSNSPRYFVPATMEERSRDSRRLPRRSSGTCPAAMRWASPSAMAVLPTPGSPMRAGLFFCRRDRIWITRRSSSSRPTTGSKIPAAACLVKSFANCSNSFASPRSVQVRVLFPNRVGPWEVPPMARSSSARRRAGSTPLSVSAWRATHSSCWSIPSSRWAVPTLVPPRRVHSAAARSTTSLQRGVSP